MFFITTSCCCREAWKQAFEPRNLVALSVQPLLVFPTHYTGEPGYITDTEDSEVIESASDDGDGQNVDAELRGEKEEL